MLAAWASLRQFARIAELEIAIDEKVRECRNLVAELDGVRQQVEHERTRRISAETMAAERREELERVISESHAVRDTLTGMVGERIKSLDALNMKLMETRTEPPPPDMSRFKPVEKQALQAVAQMRNLDRKLDIALLQKMYPQFRQRQSVPMNETVKAENEA